MTGLKPPRPAGQAGLAALRALIQERSLLASLAALHAEMGNIFQLSMPGFQPIVLVGPEANRFMLVSARNDLRWRPEGDPVVQLLRQGVLVTDGDEHDQLRRRMDPALHHKMLAGYIDTMTCATEQVSANWAADQPLDMLVEMRRLALLILMETMFKADFAPHMARLWPAILRTLSYISPGPWLVWPGIPRLGYRRHLQAMDNYLFELIRARRQAVGEADDLLGLLVTTPDMSDDLIRDQLLTMLIAGHDTSTALLAWTLYLLGQHPDVLQQVQAEVDAVLGTEPPAFERLNGLKYLEQVIKESLRLYPPIHLGMRIAATDLEFQGYHIPAGARVLYSIYLSHRMPEYWPDPEKFDPDRFRPEQNRTRPAFVYVPFGGGPRICIGFAFAEVEVKVVLARLLQMFELTLLNDDVHAHMGATLEPRPGVMMKAKRR